MGEQDSLCPHVFSFSLCRETITYAEIGCTGPGADMSKRVKWEKNLSEEEVRHLVSIRLFINQEMWLQKQLEH